jgi:hypothetical protein
MSQPARIIIPPTPAIFRWEIAGDADSAPQFQINNSDGTPFSLTGTSAYLNIRQYAGLLATLLLALTSEDNIDINTDTSIITVTIPASIATTLSWDNPAIFDMLLIDGESTYQLAYGQAFLIPGVTTT